MSDDTFYGGENKKTFLNHVFDTTHESKALILNIFQYSFLAIIPVLLLNKIIQQWIPEIDNKASSLQISLEIFLQLSVMLIGIIIIHRLVTYIPTYSGINYSLDGELQITSGVVLIFLIIVLSLQTKIGIKMNILYERFWNFWNGVNDDDDNKPIKPNTSNNSTRRSVNHANSSADHLDNNVPGVFPPMPMVQNNDKITGGDIRNQLNNGIFTSPNIPSDTVMPANSLLGSFSGLF